MESKEFRGMVGEVTEKAGEKGVFFKAKIDNKTYNFNNKPTPGSFIKGTYKEHEYDYMGEKVKSKWVEGFEVVENEPPPIEAKTMGDFQKATEVPRGQRTDVKQLMKQCLAESIEVTIAVGDGVDFSTEDIRTIANAMFIERCRRGE